LKQPRGRFIIFDGVDGSGKGSLIAVTSKALTLAGINHELTKQPGGTKLGNEIRKILFETVGTKHINPDALELLFMANHVHNCGWIEDRLSEGSWVIADRHWPSAIAYMEARGARKRMQEIYLEFQGLPWDVFFLLHGDPAKLLARAQARTTETHQDAKKWNTVENMEKTQAKFLADFGTDSHTVTVPTGNGFSAFQEWALYIGPVLTHLFDVKFDLARLKRELETPLEGMRTDQ
jgi:dTMP kinase